MRSSTFFLGGGAILSTLLSTTFATEYVVKDIYAGTTFLDGFDFVTADDRNGFVSYNNREAAATQRLLKMVGVDNYVGVDYTTPLVARGTIGRGSVRIESKKRYNRGLFILDIKHMPGGICGTAPSFWSLGEGPGFANGGMDIINGVNIANANQPSLHTNTQCKTKGLGQTGTQTLYDCALDSSSGVAGCTANAATVNTFGTGFNANGGGVYAMEWMSDAIKIWFFPRGAIPASVTADKPETSGFGAPMVNFQGDCDINSRFKDHRFVFATNFCGDQAGTAYDRSGCPRYAGISAAESCRKFVAENPSAFRNAYWQISYFKTYETPAVSSSSSAMSSTSSSMAASSSSPESASTSSSETSSSSSSDITSSSSSALVITSSSALSSTSSSAVPGPSSPAISSTLSDSSTILLSAESIQSTSSDTISPSSTLTAPTTPSSSSEPSSSPEPSSSIASSSIAASSIITPSSSIVSSSSIVPSSSIAASSSIVPSSSIASSSSIVPSSNTAPASSTSSVSASESSIVSSIPTPSSTSSSLITSSQSSDFPSLTTPTSSGASSMPSLKISPDATCGGNTGYTCKRSRFGDCCSRYGWCGSKDTYCGNGCQSSFGLCKSSASSFSTRVLPSSTKLPATPSPIANISTDAKCGGKAKTTCQGSKFGNCCSQYGWCGSTSVYCKAGCNPLFGSCKK